MIDHHAARWRACSASSSGCPTQVLDALGGGLRAVGRARVAGRAEGRGRSARVPARPAGGVRRGRAPGRRESRRRRALARKRAGKQFDPALAELMRRRGGDDPRRPRLGRDLGGGDRGRAGARGRAVWRALRRCAAGDRELRRPEVAVHPRSRARGRRSRRRGRGTARAVRTTTRCERCGAPGSSTTSAGSVSRTRSGTSAGRSAPASGSACALHPYLTERMLHQSDALAPLGAIAVQHRERLDGSGYPRGLSGAAISRPARILGAADAYQAMREPRPHRPERSADEAAAELRADVQGGSPRRRGRRGGARRRRPPRHRAAAKGRRG